MKKEENKWRTIIMEKVDWKQEMEKERDEGKKEAKVEVLLGGSREDQAAGEDESIPENATSLKNEKCKVNFRKTWKTQSQILTYHYWDF